MKRFTTSLTGLILLADGGQVDKAPIFRYSARSKGLRGEDRYSILAV